MENCRWKGDLGIYSSAGKIYNMKIRIGIVDDHQLFLKSLGLLICSFPNFELATDALNGTDLLRKLKDIPLPPDILLVDVNMPRMDGVETARNISKLYPTV